MVIPLTFNELFMVVLFDNVVYLLTFNDDKHVIGCDICLTTTYDDDVDVIPLGVPNNPKSPYEGVKNPTVFIVKLLFESIDNAPPIFNDNILNDVVPDGGVLITVILHQIYLLLN